MTFRRLHGDVAEEKLNLLQFAAGRTAEASATASEVMRREFAHANFGGELLYDMPDQLLRYPLAPNSASAAHPSE